MPSRKTEGPRKSERVGKSSTERDEQTPESKLAGQLALAWNAGNRLPVEEFLARQGAADLDPQAAVRVIFEEYCLREDEGEIVHSEEYLRRFPQWKAELELLFECQGLLANRPPRFPVVGDTLNEFRLDAELGRGGQGRVFLATQPGLADRQVVLKLTPCHGEEHLSLARVQHTNIVPLYFAREESERNLRVFCMPYLGGATLAQMLAHLKSIEPQRRTIADLKQALASQATASPAGKQPARWAAATYTEAVCMIGVALAEALHFVHERGLVHLDIKPSNVLITAEGQPLLLDFHLTREPIHPQDPTPTWFGGTPDYMAPEQRRVWEAISRHEAVSDAVDGRADVYALGLVLYEALGGRALEADRPSLEVGQPHVSTGLSDIVSRAMASDPQDRYPTGAALAVDLRRHLDDLPLVGAPNRSLAERWQKFRRRRPSALAVTGLAALVMVAAVSAGVVGWKHFESQRYAAEEALASGERLSRENRHREALDELARAERLGRGIPGTARLAQSITTAQTQTRGRQKGALLHSLVENLRFTCRHDGMSAQMRGKLAEACQSAWDARTAVLDSAGEDPALVAAIRADLLELAVLWADLSSRAPSPPERARAVAVIDQAAAALGPSPILVRERAAFAALADRSGAEISPTDLDDISVRKQLKTGWEHYAYGRALLREGRLLAASEVLELAVDLAPQDFWANFYQADCAYRMRDYSLALSALRVCISLAPEKAECYFNRGLLHAAREDWESATRDFDRALKLNPGLAFAALERGKARRRQERHQEAIVDLQQARSLGSDPATVDVELALVHLDRKDRTAAQAAVERALQANPGLEPALELQTHLQSAPR